jgi:hypothetical protein
MKLSDNGFVPLASSIVVYIWSIPFVFYMCSMEVRRSWMQSRLVFIIHMQYFLCSTSFLLFVFTTRPIAIKYSGLMLTCAILCLCIVAHEGWQWQQSGQVSLQFCFLLSLALFSTAVAAVGRLPAPDACMYVLWFRVGARWGDASELRSVNILRLCYILNLLRFIIEHVHGLLGCFRRHASSTTIDRYTVIIE